MPGTREEWKRADELRLQASELELREAELGHRIRVLEHAIKAFNGGDGVAKYKLNPKISRGLLTGIKAVTSRLPEELRSLKLFDTEELPANMFVIKINVMPLLKHLKIDLEQELVETGKRRQELLSIANALMRVG